MTGSVIFHSIFQAFVLSILLLVSWTSADPHHEPRHDGEEDDTKVAEQSVIDNSDVDLEENTEVRHHIYMPYPLAYRQSAHPPTIQYVPHYRWVHSRVSSKFEKLEFFESVLDIGSSYHI